MDANNIPDWANSNPNPKYPEEVTIFDDIPIIEGSGGKQIFLHTGEKGDRGMFPGTNAGIALILSIIGLLVCNLVTAIPALIIAYQSLRITNQYPDHPEHGVAKAAMVISWITIIIGAIIVVIILSIWGIIVSSYGI
ncbi:MAG: hypothetical protein CMA12_02625 [Euryarchaeota archaeon]|nr:hypothetical protein [Euryarchaeota archaeon]OUW22746.1 MAG: hypothetical protein CBD33_01195 [Euryarchaeota archaeon TMED173]|tara:strand:+ start:334 stop:744 length:411 start_codon:yes stop_codon:yes gene_type:complete